MGHNLDCIGAPGHKFIRDHLEDCYRCRILKLNKRLRIKSTVDFSYLWLVVCCHLYCNGHNLPLDWCLVSPPPEFSCEIFASVIIQLCLMTVEY